MKSKNERVTLRLGKKDLKEIDAFIKNNREFSSRSQLCRVAMQSFIGKGEKNECKVKYALSRQHAITRCIEKYFSPEGVKELVEYKKAIGRMTGERIQVDIADEKRELVVSK
jgi:metal-responsive CopG/Arc/MetJ family transcriptional regulator